MRKLTFIEHVIEVSKFTRPKIQFSQISKLLSVKPLTQNIICQSASVTIFSLKLLLLLDRLTIENFKLFDMENAVYPIGLLATKRVARNIKYN